jgi:hypothetical protein
VRYHFVNAMLLNEVQRQARRAEAQQREIEAQRRDMEAQQREEARQIDYLTARLVELEKALGGRTGGAPGAGACSGVEPGEG